MTLHSISPAYFETRFRVLELVHSWPRKFAIITGYATTGETWTQEESEDADRRLGSELKRRGGWLVRIVGYSPLTGHAEPSWACTMLLSEACEIGRRYRQDAIFRVNGDKLSVIRCAEPTKIVPIGFFRKRLD